MALDREKLANILNRAQPDANGDINDGEALNAIRLATKMVANAGLTWEEVLGGRTSKLTVQVVHDFTMTASAQSPLDTDAAADPHRNAAVINAMFDRVYAIPSDGGDFWQWLDSVKNQWDQHGRLTKAQYDGLRRTYARVMRSSGPK